MIRTYTYTLLAVAFLPLAIILIILGINAVTQNRKRGIWLKLAVAVNSSLAIVLGFFGSSTKAQAEDERVMCYVMVVTDVTEIDKKFESSDDWHNLETNLWNMENFIRSGDFDYDTADKLYADMKLSIGNMQNNGLINDDDAAVLLAYVGARHEYYCTAVGGVLCYDMAAIPPGKETTKKEIVDTTETLHRLYEEGKLDSDAYSTALETLEKKLELYTEKEDNAVLRQLLLDLADNRTGTYFE
jgi:hypothetical protein